MVDHGDIFDTAVETEPVIIETEPVAADPVPVPAETELVPTDPVPVPDESVPVTEETITVETIDYSPVIYDASNNICSAVLFGCLVISGVLAALKVWGFRSS